MSETIKLKAPDGVSAVSLDGGEYKVDDNGNVDVPDGAFAHLAQFGFYAAPEAEAEAEAEAAPVKPARTRGAKAS